MHKASRSPALAALRLSGMCIQGHPLEERTLLVQDPRLVTKTNLNLLQHEGQRIVTEKQRQRRPLGRQQVQLMGP
jgi:hypothetical protein